MSRILKDSFMKLRADERVRRELAQRKCEWEPVDQVSVDRVVVNDNEYQTRLDTHTADKEVVDKYVARMTAGDSFPEVVLAADRKSRRGGKPTYLVVCGKHRILAMMQLGITSFNAVVIWIEGDEDKAKARDISIHDNVANGKPVSHEVMNEQIANESIRENGGLSNGYPDPKVIRVVCERHGIKKHDSVKKHVERLLFQHECRSRRLLPPSGVDVCSAAYWFVDREGFADIAKAVCRYAEVKGISNVLRDCRRRKQAGESTIKSIVNFAAGYQPSKKGHESMTCSDRTRLKCDDLVKFMEQFLANDSSVSLRDCEHLESAVEKVCDRGSTILQSLRKKAMGA